MLAGLGVIIIGIVVTALIANSGRVSSKTGTALTEAGFRTQRRAACITDLRNESENYSGEVADAVLNRLVVLDGYDPSTGRPIAKLEVGGELVTNPGIQKILAIKYVNDGLEAQKNRKEVARKLQQPQLNEICGDPIVDKDDVSSGD